MFMCTVQKSVVDVPESARVPPLFVGGIICHMACVMFRVAICVPGVCVCIVRVGTIPMHCDAHDITLFNL